MSMNRLPPLALREKQLTKGRKTTSSSNKVCSATFEENGKTIKGYFKPVDDNYYPEVLAKYVVAFSVFVRSALGTRASEERLVYNDKDEIVGTISIEVPNFVRLLTAKDSDYKNPTLKKWGKPDKATLLEKKIAELLISAYKHKNDDLHPANISVHGIIDWDELYRELTSTIKGDRLGSGIIIDSPEVAGVLKEEDLRTFPRISGRTHWPTNKVLYVFNLPKNFNLFKKYGTDAFHELEGDIEFKQQYFTALVKELLAYDENMLEARLRLYLDKEPLNLESLTLTKRKALLDYGNKHNLFDNLEDKPDAFVQHCMRFYKMEHMKFEKMVLGTPEFRDFMLSLDKKPNEVCELKNWFCENNSYNKVPYNLEYVNHKYHHIWRECFKLPFEKQLKKLENMLILTRKVSETAQIDEGIYTLDKANELIKKLISKDYPVDQTEINLLSNIITYQLRKPITHLLNELNELKNSYYTHYPLTLKHNHEFIHKNEELLLKIAKQKETFKNWLMENKESLHGIEEFSIDIKAITFEMNELFEGIDNFSEQFKKDFLTSFKMNDKVSYKTQPLQNLILPICDEKEENKPLPTPPRYIQMDLIASPDNKITPENTVEKMSEFLKIWIKSSNESAIQLLVKKAREPYDERHRAIFRRALSIFSPPRENKDETLEEILSSGGWNSNSVNTLLIKTLCEKMCEEKNYQCLYKDKNESWWKSNAKQIAYLSGIMDGSTKPGMSKGGTEKEAEAKFY